ncbi:MAG: glycosyltransferase [Lachnospiraceae bacterium]|nr:glycosyltransferase [Lachnospiraceae bacterium]
MNNQSISICIITKNECDMLKQCLEHITPYAQDANHEIIIVDTGSSDNTVEMCKEFTDNIFFFEWIKDFSAARNFAAEKASNDWILCIDSDEYVSTWDEKELQKHMQKYPNIIGNIIQRNTCGFGKNQHISNDRASRFYNRKYYHFCRSIHEQLEPINPKTGYHYLSLNIIVDHMSYAGTPEELYGKAERNIGMLTKELEQNPHDPYTLFQLGQSYYMIGDFENALVYYDRGLSEDVNPNLGYVRTMVNSFGYTLLELKDYGRALELEGVYETFADRADFVFLMGLIYLNNALFSDAIIQFEKATTFPFSTVDGANSYRAWHNLGVIYECMGYKDKAYEYYKKCGNFPPALARIHSIEKH